MICQHCEAGIPDNSSFCTYCGAPLVHPTNYRLDLGKLLGDTFELYKRNFGTLCLIGLVLLAVPLVFMPLDMVTSFVQDWAKQAGNRALFIAAMSADVCFQILQVILGWYIALGVIRQCLYLARGGTGFQMSMMFSPFMMFLKYAGLMLVIMCIVMPFFIPGAGMVVASFFAGLAQKDFSVVAIALVAGGGLLLFIGWCAAIWISIRLYLAPVFIADQDTGIADSMVYSWRISSGNFWILLLTSIVLGVLAMLGVFLCCVGIIFTAAIPLLGLALAYLQLTGQPNCLDYPPPFNEADES